MALRGIPRYRKGSSPSFRWLSIFIFLLLSSLTPAKYSSLFLRFSFSPDVLVKISNFPSIYSTELKFPLRNSSRSSANTKCITGSLYILDVTESQDFYVRTSILYSDTPIHKTNKCGDMGSPCLSPFFPINGLVSSPFTFI